MEAWERVFYGELGRFVICPSCKNHSDLTLDQPAAPEDPVPMNLRLEGKITKGCREFHESSLVAWLWFKHHGKDTTPPPAPEPPEFDSTFGPV